MAPDRRRRMAALDELIEGDPFIVREVNPERESKRFKKRYHQKRKL